MSMGKRIKERRLQLGMSADDLAEKLGKNRATNFPVSIIEPLAAALLTTPAYLMGWTDNPATITQEPANTGEPEDEEFSRLYHSLSEKNRKRILDLMQVLSSVQEEDDDSDETGK